MGRDGARCIDCAVMAPIAYFSVRSSHCRTVNPSHSVPGCLLRNAPHGTYILYMMSILAESSSRRRTRGAHRYRDLGTLYHVPAHRTNVFEHMSCTPYTSDDCSKSRRTVAKPVAFRALMWLMKSGCRISPCISCVRIHDMYARRWKSAEPLEKAWT